MAEDPTRLRVMEEARAVSLRERTTNYLRRVVRFYRSLPREVVEQTLQKNLSPSS